MDTLSGSSFRLPVQNPHLEMALRASAKAFWDSTFGDLTYHSMPIQAFVVL